MRFVTFFPELRSFHLKKDVGLIPILLKKYNNYDVKIVTYKNEKIYEYNRDELKIEFIERKYGVVIDFLKYLLKNSRSIDVLNLYHITSERNFKWVYIYKFLNRKGKVFLKLDADKNIKLYDYNKKTFKQKIKNYILRKVDLITVENYTIKKYIEDSWGIEVEFLPNGFYDNNEMVKNIKDKNNTILTVGRIGTYQKATEILLEAFARSYKNLNEQWNLVIVGEIDEGFKGYIEEYKKRNADILSKIEFIGNVEDFDEIRKFYRDSKIFCLPSRYESFGLVLVEALMEGCYIITSDHEAATTIVKNDNIGLLFELENIEDLCKKLIYACNNIEFNENIYENIRSYAYNNFYWKDIIAKLDKLIKLASS